MVHQPKQNITSKKALLTSFSKVFTTIYIYKMYLFVATTALSFVAAYSNNITQPILNWAYRTTSFERSLLTTKAELKFEQSKLSMVDEFARYSKIQRKINRIDHDLSELQSQRRKYNFVVRMLFTYGVKFLFGVALLWLSVYYRKSPVLHISKNYNLFPLGYIISYPNCCVNCVSVPFWIMCCTTVGSLVTYNV